MLIQRGEILDLPRDTFTSTPRGYPYKSDICTRRKISYQVVGMCVKSSVK